MIATGSPLLTDPEQYAQAVSVLKREELSPRDEWLFRWLVRATTAAFLLSGLWVVVVMVAADVQLYVLITATVCQLSVCLFTILNAPLLWKLMSASRRERALKLTRPLRTIAAREPDAWSRRIGKVALVVIAVVALYWGIVGVSVWAETNTYGRLVAICSLSTGFACLLIYLVDRARRRRRALQRLQAAIDEATDGTIDPVYYDAIVCIERAQIVQDRKEAMERAPARLPPVLRMTDEFREQLNALEGADVAATNAMIRELSVSQHDAANEPPPQTRVIRPGLSLNFVRNRDRNDILLLGLTARGGRNNG